MTTLMLCHTDQWTCICVTRDLSDLGVPHIFLNLFYLIYLICADAVPHSLYSEPAHMHVVK